MNVTMVQREKMLFTWNSMFGNDFYGEGEDLVLGNKGTILCKELAAVRYTPQGRKAEAAEAKASGAAPDIVGGGDTTDEHMQNFFDCVRNRKEPNCPFDIGFRSAITCQMAITSYRRGRTVRWDAEREEIV
jgi:hypothetical protein